jgi:hypothetical protein
MFAIAARNGELDFGDILPIGEKSRRGLNAWKIVA